MTRAEALAYNAGVTAAIAFASALTEDIRATLGDDAAEARRSGVAALEAFYETAPTLLLPVPPLGPAEIQSGEPS